MSYTGLSWRSRRRDKVRSHVHLWDEHDPRTVCGCDLKYTHKVERHPVRELTCRTCLHWKERTIDGRKATRRARRNKKGAG